MKEDLMNKLPKEIFTKITTYLESDDILNMKLTSKKICNFIKSEKFQTGYISAMKELFKVSREKEEKEGVKVIKEKLITVLESIKIKNEKFNKLLIIERVLKMPFLNYIYLAASGFYDEEFTKDVPYPKFWKDNQFFMKELFKNEIFMKVCVDILITKYNLKKIDIDLLNRHMKKENKDDFWIEVLFLETSKV